MPTTPIILNSRQAISRQGNQYNFQISPIAISNEIEYFISVKHIMIPYSFYQNNADNTSIEWTLDGAAQPAIALPQGNYNINTLIAFLNAMTGTTGLTFSYQTYNNKVRVSRSDSLEFVLLASSTAFQQLGFTEGLAHASAASVLISDNVVNMINTMSLKVTSNLIIDSRDSGQSPNTLIVMPVNRQINSVLESSQDWFTRVRVTSDITNVFISIYNQDNEVVDLNGLNFEILLLLSW